jgi:hypothetical protein
VTLRILTSHSASRAIVRKQLVPNPRIVAREYDSKPLMDATQFVKVRCLKVGEKFHKSRIVPPFDAAVSRAQFIKRFAESLRTHQKISFRRP